MSTEQKEKSAHSRRGFFARLAAGIGGGLAAGSVLPVLAQSAEKAASERSITVSIHPMAVSRTNESVKSHGE